MPMRLRAVTALLSLLLIAGCGGGGGSPSPVTIGGTVTGLVGKLVLQDNAGDNLAVTANGAFTFAIPLNKGAAYAVTVLTQPPGPTCVVSNGSGAATANVTSVSVTCTADPATVFLPILASAVPGATPAGASGLFVISSKSPGDPPIQITTQGVDLLGQQTQYNLSAQGKVSAGNPHAMIYTTINSSSGDHVWSLNLSATSTLVPTQLSNLTIPYHTEHVGMGFNALVQYCASLVIPKNLADPSSAFLILALPTEETLCAGNPAAFKWLLIHPSDGPTTDPVNLALSGPILPLYRPDGTLGGLVAIDASNNLNFYSDETFTNPRVLLANVRSFTPYQEALAGSISGISTNPTYSFLLVEPKNVNSGPVSVYRIDYSGSISADLYDFGDSGETGFVVDSGNLYFIAYSGTELEEESSVVKISGGGGPAQVLGSTSLQIGYDGSPPTLVGISGSHLVLSGSTPQQQGYVETLATSAPGPFTTIATSGSLADVSLAGGDVFVNWAHIDTSMDSGIQYSTQILDGTGNVLQDSMPSSSFVSNGAPIIQVRNITDSSGLGGGGVYFLDLSQPSSPAPVPLKTATGTAFNLPSGVESIFFIPVAPTIGVADGTAPPSGGTTGALVYDLAKGVVVPVSMPNSIFSFLTEVVPPL